MKADLMIKFCQTVVRSNRTLTARNKTVNNIYVHSLLKLYKTYNLYLYKI